MSEHCLFCQIAQGKIPAREIFRDDEIIAIYDINPQAPTHVLVIPVRHGDDLHGFTVAQEPGLIGRLLLRAAEIGKALGPSGYRVVINAGADGGQTVNHLHLHVLAGRAMGWPPFPPGA